MWTNSETVIIILVAVLILVFTVDTVVKFVTRWKVQNVAYEIKKIYELWCGYSRHRHRTGVGLSELEAVYNALNLLCKRLGVKPQHIDDFEWREWKNYWKER